MSWALKTWERAARMHRWAGKRASPHTNVMSLASPLLRSFPKSLRSSPGESAIKRPFDGTSTVTRNLGVNSFQLTLHCAWRRCASVSAVSRAANESARSGAGQHQSNSVIWETDRHQLNSLKTYTHTYTHTHTHTHIHAQTNIHMRSPEGTRLGEEALLARVAGGLQVSV